MAGREDRKARAVSEENHEDLKRAVREICAGFPGPYWRALDEKRYRDLSVFLVDLRGAAGSGLTAKRR